MERVPNRARRRRFLAGLSAAGLASTAGCLRPLLDEGGSAESGSETGAATRGANSSASGGEGPGIHVDALSLSPTWEYDHLLWDVTADDGSFYGLEDQRRVDRVDADGTVLWESAPISDDRYVLRLGPSMAVDGRSAFVGADGYSNDLGNGLVVAFDAETGERRWEHVTPTGEGQDVIRAIRAVDDGVVYGAASHGSGDDQTPTFRKLSVDGSVQWETSHDTGFAIGLAQYEDRLYAATTQSLYAYDASTGEVRETFDVTPSFSGITRAESTLYAFDWEDLYAFDPDDGTERWSTSLEFSPETRLTVGDGAVYVGTEAGHVLSLDAESGERRWDQRVEHSVTYRPVADGEFVWVIDTGGDLYALAAGSGDVVHHRTLESAESQRRDVSVAVTDDVVVTDWSATAFAVDQPS